MKIIKKLNLKILLLNYKKMSDWEDDINYDLKINKIELNIDVQMDKSVEEELIICEICGYSYSSLNSLNQHKRTCIIGTKLFKNLVGENIIIDKDGFSEFLRKNGWNNTLKSWCIDTVKNKKVKIADRVKQEQTKVYYTKQSHLILWALTQLYLQYLKYPNHIEGIRSWSEKTHLSLDKIKDLNINIYLQELWNGWRNIIKDILPLLPPKFDGLDIIPVTEIQKEILRPIKKGKDLDIQKEIDNIDREITILRNGKALFYTFNTIEEALNVKNNYIRYKDFFKNIGFDEPQYCELPHNCILLNEMEFEKDITQHENFVKNYINKELNKDIFFSMIDELKILSGNLYIPYGELIFNNIQKYLETTSQTDKKFMLAQIGRKSILSNSINGSLGKIIHDEDFFQKIKVNIH